MLKYKLFTVYIFLHTLFCSCSSADHEEAGFTLLNDAFEVERIGTMPAEVQENSGLALSSDGMLWTHNDAGHSNFLYKINLKGELQEQLLVEGAKNKDWEDITRDDKGNLYIGDFGNNNNKRKNLRIYKVSEASFLVLDTIDFRYPDQKEFPPHKSQRNFDCEGFFWDDAHLYLFSKNRGKSRYTKMYRLPDSGSNHVAELVDSVEVNTMITGAAISPDRKQMALLGYGYLYLFDLSGDDNFLKGKKYCVPVGKSGQAEGIVYLNNNEILFSNEGGKIFKVSAKKKN